jgi:hypothetical protein
MLYGALTGTGVTGLTTGIRGVPITGITTTDTTLTGTLIITGITATGIITVMQDIMIFTTGA